VRRSELNGVVWPRSRHGIAAEIFNENNFSTFHGCPLANLPPARGESGRAALYLGPPVVVGPAPHFYAGFTTAAIGPAVCRGIRSSAPHFSRPH